VTEARNGYVNGKKLVPWQRIGKNYLQSQLIRKAHYLALVLH